MKKKLIKYLIYQELIYATFCAVIATLLSIDHGAYVALKAFGYCLLFLQPVIIFVNRVPILELISRDKK